MFNIWNGSVCRPMLSKKVSESGADRTKIYGGGAVKRTNGYSRTTTTQSTYTPLNGSEDLFMTSNYTREMCSFKVYASCVELIEDALVGGPCRNFVLWFVTNLSLS